MFIGHFGLGFAAKKPAPLISLGLLFIAAQFLDLLWPLFLLLHLERVEINPDPQNMTPLDFTHYPWSHSLAMVLVWSLLFAGIYWLFTKNRKYALILGLLVLSHWVLDLVVHVPDLPLYPGASPMAGLGLWRWPFATGIVEGIIFFGGIAVYTRATRAKNTKGRILLWVLVGLLLISHIANLAGPPPPDVATIAWAGNLQWIFVLLAFWADKNREARSVGASADLKHVAG